MPEYTEQEFELLTDLRRQWLNCYEDGAERFRLAVAADAIVYKDYTPEQRMKIRVRKRQTANYVKVRISCPDMDAQRDSYITEEDITVNDPPKILFGVMELANVAATMCEEFRSRRIEAYSLDFFIHPFKYATDLSRYRQAIPMEKVIMLRFISELIAEFDIFNFFWCQTLLYSYDMPVYRELDKKVVMHYSGGEIRLYSDAVRHNPYLSLAEGTYFYNHEATDLGNLYTLLLQSNYAHAAVAYNNEFARQLNLGYEEYYEIPQPIILKNLVNDALKEPNERFTIVHAPSNAYAKGSAYIAEAIGKLKQSYDFEYVNISGIPFSEAIAVYKRADLIIDQLIIGWHGILSLEAMALGKPVMCYLCEDFFKQPHTGDIPIINTSVDNLTENIEWALNNREGLVEIGQRGVEYVKTHHDSKRIAELYLRMFSEVPLAAPTKKRYYIRLDTQSIEEAITGIEYLATKDIYIASFLITNKYLNIGLYGGDRRLVNRITAMLGQDIKASVNIMHFNPVNPANPAPNGNDYDLIILLMESGVNAAYNTARSLCPPALIVTLNELVLLSA